MAAVAYTPQRGIAYTSNTAKLFSMVFSNSYPALGELVTPANVGLVAAIDMIIFGVALSSSGGFALMVSYDPVNRTVRAFYPTGGTDTAPSTVAMPLTKSGASTASAVDATRPNLTPGAGKEVATGADLSAFTVYGLAFGAN